MAKLDIWNAALLELGDRPLASLTENAESRRVLDAAWDRVVADCISEASWNFAMRTVLIDYDPDVDPAFGFQYAFEKPTDWVNTIGISEDEFLDVPLTRYHDDGSYWYAECTPIYVRYVSNDNAYGLDLSKWTSLFVRYVELELAARICLRINQNASMREAMEKLRDKARLKAKNKDAMNEAQPKFLPDSGWTLARFGRGSRDRGSRGNLTG